MASDLLCIDVVGDGGVRMDGLGVSPEEGVGDQSVGFRTARRRPFGRFRIGSRTGRREVDFPRGPRPLLQITPEQLALPVEDDRHLRGGRNG